MTAYATPSDMLIHADARDIGDLVADDGQQVSAVDLLTNPILLEFLTRSSGDVESALVVGNRYSVDQLENLTGNSKAKLVDLVCDLTVIRLLKRRPGKDLEQLKLMSEMADVKLDRLRKGENIFDLTAIRNASVVSVDGPTTLEFQDLNLVRDRIGNRYFPSRVLPHNR